MPSARSSMTGLCFVDAEVFVYARDPRDAAKQSRALQWIAHLWQERLGRTSVQVPSEYYVFATRTLKPHVAPGAAWDDVQELMAWRPLPLDETLLRRAREIEQRWDLSWRDSMAVGAAQLQDCVLLLTDGLPDGPVFGSLTARSPFTLSVGQPLPGYSVLPRAAIRLRPRGR